MTKEISWINFLEVRRLKQEDLDKVQLVLNESGFNGEEWSGQGTVLVAELGSQILGTVSVNSSGCIHSLAVASDARRRGIGSLLLSELEAEMARAGRDKAYLVPQIEDFDRLLAFYGKRGYTLLGSSLMSKNLA